MRLLLAVVILLSILLVGCLGGKASVLVEQDQLDVFGIVMGASTDYREIHGIKGTDEPCLRGFERTFDALDIVIGYGHNGRVRKIASRNSQNSMFGVHPGDPFEVLLVRVRDAGFVPAETSNRFRKEGLVLTALVDSANKIFGLTLETIDLP